MRTHQRNVFGSPGLRLLQLYMVLGSGNRTYSLTRLSHIFSCSRQTVLRMVEQLQQVRGVSIQTWLSGKERQFQLVPATHSPGISFTAETLGYLGFCRDILKHLLPEPVQREITETLGAFPDFCMSETSAGAAPIAEPLVKGRIDYSGFQTVLQEAQTAMRDKRLCRVVYRSRSRGGRENHLVAPLRIISYREALYLRCRIYERPDRASEEFRTLAVHRINALTLLKDTFQDVYQDDKEPAFGFPYHEPIQVRVAFRGGAAAYVAERTWSPDQKLRKRRDGTLELTFTSTSRLEVISWVLGFGPEAELLEPKDVRNELAENAKAIASRYYAGAGPQSRPVFTDGGTRSGSLT